jgi:hypothetical protein
MKSDRPPAPRTPARPPADVLDPDAPPSAEEIAAAEQLRVALEEPARPSDDAELLRAVALAAHPPALDPAAQRSAEQAALARFDELRSRRTRGTVVRVTFGLSVAFAAAAAIALVVGRPAPRPSAAADLVHVRSTQELFSQRFEAQGGESARIDRIAIARAADLRENRFARWGVGGGRRQ